MHTKNVLVHTIFFGMHLHRILHDEHPENTSACMDNKQEYSTYTDSLKHTNLSKIKLNRNDRNGRSEGNTFREMRCCIDANDISHRYVHMNIRRLYSCQIQSHSLLPASYIANRPQFTFHGGTFYP
eukprot:260032_1